MIQKIYFGCPGTGKSHTIENTDLAQTLKIEKNSVNHIHTVFHPEYSYGDFMGKLVPISRAGKVEYKFRSGHFLRALGQAYKNIIVKLSENAPENPQNVALVIDEINRGNCAAIFGSVFQLLDRDNNSWSSYAITLNEIEFDALLREMGYGIGVNGKGETAYFTSDGRAVEDIEKDLNKITDDEWKLSSTSEGMKIKLPPNLSIIASMNTSDNSVYLMDSAFKRRWGWQFMDWESVKEGSERTLAGITPDAHFSWPEQKAPIIGTQYRWAPTETEEASFIVELNRFIKSHHESIRGIEDKQLGPYFIPAHVKKIPMSGSDNSLENKVMHFIWDTVFQRDKKPLMDVINEFRKVCKPNCSQLQKRDLVTFGDFVKYTADFVNAIMMPHCEWNGKLVPAAEWNGKLIPAAAWKGKLVPAVSHDNLFLPICKNNIWPQIIAEIKKPKYGLIAALNGAIALPAGINPGGQEGPDDLYNAISDLDAGAIKTACIDAITCITGQIITG